MPKELSQYGREAELADRVRTLCKRDANYITLLRSIISVDKAYEDINFGWQFKDVDWSGAHVNILMQHRIVKYGYKSNSATHYRLAVNGDEL